MLRLATPVVLAELGWVLQGVVDTIMVGHLGPVAIGAVALGNALYYAPSLFGLGLLLGLDTVISQAFGRGDFEACHRALAQGVWIALGVSPLLMALFFGVSLLPEHFGIAPELVRPAVAYLRVLLWGTLPLLLYAAARRYLQAAGQVGVITWTFLIANLVNWGGNYAFIYGHWGMPALGVRGSALSTVFSRILMAAMLFFFSWRYERRRGHSLFTYWAGPTRKQIVHLLGLGIPIAMQLLVEVGAFGATAILAGRISATALAAHQIALNYASIVFMVPLGISSASAVEVGQAVGAAQPRRARRSGLLALGLGLVFMGCAAAIFLSLPRQLISLYTKDAAVIATGVPLLALAGAFALFDAAQVISTGSLRGMGRTRMPMIANLLGYWVLGLPLGVLLAFHFRYGVLGLWIGLTAALIVIAVAVLHNWLYHSARLVTRSEIAISR